MIKIIVMILTISMVLVGCSAETPSKAIVTPAPISTPGEPIKNSGNMGITVNKISFKTIESDTQISERGFKVKQVKDGYHITICSGQKPSAGYDIAVKFVEDNEGKTNIMVDEISPKEGDAVATVITHPVTTISIGNNISPDFYVSNTKGEVFDLIK